MTPTKYGLQPAKAILDKERWSAARAAQEIGVKYTHLVNVLRGRCRPNNEVRERLPKLVGVPLEDLFTPEMLAPPYVHQQDARTRSWARVSRRSL